MWLPHDKFYSGRHTFDPSLKLGPKEAADLELLVECQEPAGSVVENAFVILQLIRLGRPWRAFGRHRLARIHRRTPMDGVRAAEGGG